MKINLNSLMQDITPDPITIEVGSGSFVVNDLSVGEVIRLGNFGKVKTDADARQEIDFLAGLFKGEAPPQIAELRDSLAKGDDENYGDQIAKMNRVALLASAISVACAEVAGPKKVLLAAEKIRQQLTGIPSSGSSPA